MNRLNKSLAATVMMAALLFTSAAQAMEIRQFDKMASQDRSAYVAGLVIGAQRVLIDAGKSDVAAQVNKLFTEKLGGDDVPLGVVEFNKNLAIARVADAKNHLKKPNEPRVEVEDAMFLTLQRNHIDLPDNFFTVNSNFHPKFPPQSQ